MYANTPGMQVRKDGWIYRQALGFTKGSGGATKQARELDENPILGPSASRPGSAVPSSRPQSAAPGNLQPLNQTAPLMGSSASLRRPASAAPSLAQTWGGNSKNAAPESPNGPPSPDGSGGDTLTRPKSAAQIPRYIETEKQVLRFYAHFFERKRVEPTIEFRRTNTTSEPARLVTILIYLFDETVEIHEEKVLNSGVSGGAFLGRGPLRNPEGRMYRIPDFQVGITYDIVGQRITITDADKFTRDYYSRQLGITLRSAFPRPPLMRTDIGAQAATGLGAKIPKDYNASAGTVSRDYLDKKEQLEKTNRFLKYEGHVLKFKCVETKADGVINNFSESLVGSVSEFGLYFYLSDNSLEVKTIKSKKASLDDPNVLLKRGRIPKNWREVPRGAPAQYYTIQDLVCGSIVDCYGRYLMILEADESTQEFYRNMGIEQHTIELVKPTAKPIEHKIPILGDGFLPIGGEDATMVTVYGQQQELKNWRKQRRNYACILRCRAKMLSDDAINKSRNFTITFYMEDDTLSVFEDVVRNSGLVGGNYLKRGKYKNELPPDSDVPRIFAPTDMYLGNVICVNGCEFKLYEMDEMTLDFCENNPEEFPMHDAFQIVSGLLYKVNTDKLDLRRLFSNADRERRNWVSNEIFVRCLDDFGLATQLNEQETLTLVRRVRGEGAPGSRTRAQCYYNELVDLFSHMHYVSRAGTQQQRGRPGQDAFLMSLRGRKTQWRNLIRLDASAGAKHIYLRDLIRLFDHLGTRLSLQNQTALVAAFAVKNEAERSAAVQELKRKREAAPVDHVHNVDLAHMASSRPKSASASMSVSQRRQEILSNRAQSSRRGDGRQAQSSEEQDAVIDFMAMCDQIYPCDWI